MTSRLKISIAMCTYNGERFISEQLESIAQQSLLPDELVVCDDGSTDRTLALVEDFSRRVGFPVHLHRNDDNLGPSKNFEKAIGLCSGEVIVLSDQDDVWLPSKLERIINVFLSRPDVGIVFTDAELVDDELRPMGLQLWNSVRFTGSQQQTIRKGGAEKVLLKHNVVTGATMAFRSLHRDRVLPIPELWSHDAWIALLLSFVSEVAIIPEALVLYRQHADNQIGVGALKTKAERWKGRTFAERCLKRKSKYESAYRRVTTAEEWGGIDTDILRRLEAKVRHLEARHAMTRGGWRRVLLALRETVLLRYHRFSERDRAFLSDLFRAREGVS